MSPWEQIEAEAEGAFRKFPLRAYSEFMPPPYIGLKPYGRHDCATFGVSGGDALDIDEYEQAHDVEPGLAWIADHLVAELTKLVRGKAHALSSTLLDGNPAWPAELVAAAHAGKLAHDPVIVACALALSRTQDDKGNDRWTLFGASHEGPAAPFWHGMTEDALGELLAWAGLDRDWRIVAPPDELPAALRGRISNDAAPVIVTFQPFANLPEPIRAGYLAGTVVLVPTPAALVFFEHPKYRKLSKQLPRAMQVPLLHVFPRIESACAIRIPQSGWLDETDPTTGLGAHAHKIVSHVVRSHRWERVARDADIHGDGRYTDKVSVALFSTDPEAVDLYDKPIARNSQIWTESYELLLDGPSADRAALAHAAGVVDAGGRFGYRMYYPPMRAGKRELFWHVPVIARSGKGRFVEAPNGYATAELAGAPAIRLEPRMLERPSHVAAARLFERDPGRARHTTSINVRKLLDMRALLGEPLAPSLGRALVHIGKHGKLEDWLADLPTSASDRAAAARLTSALVSCVGAEPPIGEPIVLGELGTRAFEEKIWNNIHDLAHGKFRQKNDADGIRVNRGKHGGKAAKAAHITTHERNDLVALGDHLKARYRELGVEALDHAFKWETDFEFPWMEGWANNQTAPGERNIVCVIPGNNRNQAVIMGDHYDTAYMEDVYYKESGGDELRAPACGADDNHSATTALLLAAEQLVPLSRAGKLERDVWLVHLTGEEFPGDCMGARALGQALVERSLVLGGRDFSHVEVVGAYILDMIGHTADRDRDVFQIAPGEGAGSARLARRAHRANVLWNQKVKEWKRPGGRATRGSTLPPPFKHLALHGEVRVEWEPRSALFNTDGQIFSDLGVPVVLFMENYDISRKGYHDTHDTMENIDLDYCAALTAIAIETVADTACARIAW